MIFNPLLNKYKSITGAVADGQILTFFVEGDFDYCYFVCTKEGDNTVKHYMDKVQDGFSVSLMFNEGLYFYYFETNLGFISLNPLNYEGYISNEIKEFQLTSYLSSFDTPKWLKGGIIYQIFPDRFNRSRLFSDIKINDGKILIENQDELPCFKPNKDGKVLNNDFFGGDLKGIISKIKYLKGLGVTAIYLNPIFKAYSNHRYDTGNYEVIDEMLGDMNDLDNLIDVCEKNGLKIILDGVFNHTGDDSLYFNKYNHYNSIGAYQSKNSPYASWYSFENFPENYKSWWGIKTLPTIKKGSGYEKYITDKILPLYTKKAIGGWRLDVVDELPDNFVKEIRKSVKKINNECMIIGEVWEDASNKISYGVRREYFRGQELDSVMNYPLKNAILNFCLNKNCKELKKVVLEQIDHYPKQVLDCLMNILSTHDTVRLLSALSGIDISCMNKEEQSKIIMTEEQLNNSVKLLKISTLLQFTLYGVPSIYYGDEIGMQGFSDPLNRCFMMWDNINTEILKWYKKIAKIRKSISAFTDGTVKIKFTNDNVFIFERTNSESSVLIGVNLSDKDIVLSYNGKLLNLLNNRLYDGVYTLNSNDCCVMTNMSE